MSFPVGRHPCSFTISTNHQPATDLGYLLHKHPDRCQTFNLPFGKAHVFYPEASDERSVACRLLDVDPVGLVRGKDNWNDGLLNQCVNDRPFVASSLMSVAISQVFGSALAGRSKEQAELVDMPIPLIARLDVLPVRGGDAMLERMFGPLGYAITAKQHPLDEKFPEWGESPYYSVELEQSTTVARLLQHLYVLIPVFDGKKHYYIGPDEVEKLLSKGESWLSDPPRLAAFERVVFEHAQPRTVVVTTPNREYIVVWELLPAGEMRHSDHRFEWSSTEFQTWAGGVAERFGYSARYLRVGPEEADVGAPSQMAILEHILNEN